jgi:hypothetical protein
LLALSDAHPYSVDHLGEVAWLSGTESDFDGPLVLPDGQIAEPGDTWLIRATPEAVIDVHVDRCHLKPVPAHPRWVVRIWPEFEDPINERYGYLESALLRVDDALAPTGEEFALAVAIELEAQARDEGTSVDETLMLVGHEQLLPTFGRVIVGLTLPD